MLWWLICGTVCAMVCGGVSVRRLTHLRAQVTHIAPTPRNAHTDET